MSLALPSSSLPSTLYHPLLPFSAMDMDEEGAPAMHVGVRELPLMAFVSFLLFLAGGLAFTYLRFRAQARPSRRRNRRGEEDWKPPRHGWATPPPRFEDAILQTPPVIVIHGGGAPPFPPRPDEEAGTRQSSNSSSTQGIPPELNHSGISIVRIPSVPPPVYLSKPPSPASSVSD
ncbi:hypothetical protein BJ684DRAFT_21811 [Piptocephalis cylindrospora]|uniref:Uncharacterized protein n=1 Tax=Piptocephalis cylindrospora TaxID=1907219 RepID=A0A4P9XZ01_9FUNG|nr:hypothetical protein BJ684DRAFT_21811 [Piptocephalis cylindrospora]|eukprot:RKP11614.1 hypothetical protein BJ684DRAFT_21811 [Piptocephalis cylindrospora]